MTKNTAYYMCGNPQCSSECLFPEAVYREHPAGGPICEECWSEETFDREDSFPLWDELPPYISPETRRIRELEARVAELEEKQRWRDMKDAPRDATMLQLLVEYSGDCNDHPLFDSDKPSVTVGFNQFDHTGDDAWLIAGWCWSHDHFTQGHGTPIGWMPLPEPPEEGE